MVKWEIIQKPKKLGRLGVGDLVIKIAAFLFNWWWRYSDEGNSLWKRVVCSIYGCDTNRLVDDHDLIRSGGPWKHIRDISSLKGDISEVVSRGLKKVVGNEVFILFWDEVWLGE